MHSESQSLSSRLRLCTTVAVLSGLMTGCGTAVIRHPLPQAEVTLAGVPGLPDVRGWGDGPSATLRESLVRMREQRATQPSTGTAEILALSGGGMNGAFGAGLLVGWGGTGNRPRFDLVTGVSAGGLLAPFAFLGDQGDEALRRVFAELKAEDMFDRRSLWALTYADAMLDASPLAALLEREITPELLELVAAEHRRGRRLWVSTFNLDAGRPVVWDLGAIAGSGQPQALALFRDVLRASAAIPGLLPPVYFQVEAGGRRYDEMHVDGGVGNQVFGYGLLIDGIDRGDLRRVPARVWILRNGRQHAIYQPVAPRVGSIASAAVGGLTHFQGDGDVYKIFVFCQRDHLQFNYLAIPDDVDPVPLVDPPADAMRDLFEVGRRLGADGSAWSRLPPGYTERTR